MTKAKILQLCAIDVSIDVLLKPLVLESMDKGYEVHCVCSDTGKFDQLRAEGLTMIDVKIDRKISPGSNWASIMELYRLMKKEQYDIVHVHTPVAALLGRVAAKMAGIEHVIYTAHGFYFHDEMPKKQYDFFVKIEKYAAKHMTDWLLLQSVEDYEFSLLKKFKPVDRTIHLSNGVDIWSKFHPTLVSKEMRATFHRQEKIEEGDFVFSFIGRLVREKGIFELIEAFKKLADQFPNVKLLVIGTFLESERDQESRAQLQKELQHPNIRHLGFRKDIPLLMAASDTFVLPSYREGLPRSIIEAMAMEKPVIATNIRGCREEVFEGENGFLVPRGDANQLFRAMKKLLLQPQLVEQFSKKSREIAELHFDEAKVLSKQMELFESLLVELPQTDFVQEPAVVAVEQASNPVRNS